MFEYTLVRQWGRRVVVGFTRVRPGGRAVHSGTCGGALRGR